MVRSPVVHIMYVAIVQEKFHKYELGMDFKEGPVKPG